MTEEPTVDAEDASDTTAGASLYPLSVRNVQHWALRNVFYHEARLRSFDFRNRLATFMTVILGTAAAADIGSKLLAKCWPNLAEAWTPLLGGVIAVNATLQLVFDWPGFARVHTILLRDYNRILADSAKYETPTREQEAEWTSELIKLGQDEPPILRALSAISDNEAQDALGVAADQRLHIPWWRAWTANWCRHANYRFDRQSER